MKAKTLKQLKWISGLTMVEITKQLDKQTYYNIINGKHTPTKKNIEKFCNLFDIDEKEFQKLYKLTLKTNNKK